MQLSQWLLFVYKLPTEPSRHRVAIWRAIKASGAVYLQNSVCVLPDLPSNRKLFEELSRQVHEAGGENVCLVASAIDQTSHAKIVEKFNQERDLEYSELVQECGKFLQEIEYETQRRNFTFSELEENESNLERLVAWLKKIENRDFFGASCKEHAREQVRKCQAAFDSFAAKVYEREGE